MSAIGGNISLLFLVGGDDPDSVVRIGSKIKVTGTTDLRRLLLKSDSYHRLHVTRNLLRQARRPELSQYRCLVNFIAEPEQNAKVLEIVRKLLRHVPGKIVNRPEAVLRSTRDRVAAELSGIDGLIVPSTVRLPAGKVGVAAQRLESAGLRSPIILRQAGTHSGRIVGRFDTIESLLPAIDQGADHVASQFIDFRSTDGLYRKYRVFFIGPHMILRHKLISDDWNVHAKDRARFMAERPELVAEERALFDVHEAPFSPSTARVLNEIRERIPLDFFGIDFGVTADDKVVLFEANATMNFFPFSPDPQFAYLQKSFVPAQSAFRSLLGLGAVQLGGSSSAGSSPVKARGGQAVRGISA